MSRTEANKEYTNFVAGLITEATPLTYPANSSLDEENFVLSRKGSRSRRLGMDYETNYAITDTGNTSANFSSKAVSTFEWTNINGDSKVDMLVVQIGNELYFYDLLASSQSAAIKNGGNTVVLNNNQSDRVQYATALGRLIIVTGSTKITVLEYDAANDNVVLTTRNLYVRDLLGVDDGLGVSVRPGTLSDEHKYNLLNQGWSDANMQSFFSKEGLYPSNADVMQLGKDTNGVFDPTVLVGQNSGTTPAAKGRNILDAFSRGSSRSSGGSYPRSPIPFTGTFSGALSNYAIFSSYTATTPLPDDATTGGCTAIAQYAGRVFYSGASSDLTGGDSKSPNLGAYVFYSQVVDNLDKVNKCYQDADPTSENISDIIASDGGAVKIVEARGIVRLAPVANGLVVFASNGVWQILGDSNSGFSATGFQVVKVSDVGALSPEAVVPVDNILLYWAKAGIYILQPDQVSGRLSAQSVTLSTIQTLYNSIPQIVKRNAVGSFDETANQVRWLYTLDTAYDGVADVNKFTEELVFDLALKAFYKLSIKQTATDSPYTAAYVKIEDVIVSTQTLDVVSSADDVVTATGDDVVTTLDVFGRGAKAVKYLIVVPSSTFTTGLTVGLYSNTSFRDWAIKDGTGVDANAFLVTGYDTFSDTQRNKKATYITTHMQFTDSGFDTNLDPINTSSCTMQGQWEWTNSATSGRWTSTQQIYRLKRPYFPSGGGATFDYGFDVITTRNKVRGKGRSISLKFVTEPDKDCVLLGWAINITGETKV